MLSYFGYFDTAPQGVTVDLSAGGTINPSVYSTDEWARKLAAGNRVMLAVLKQRKIFLIGTEDSIPRLR